MTFTADSLPPSPNNPCRDGYISWYKNCYRLVSEPKTWAVAQEACQQEGGNLASVDMSYEQAFISGAVILGRSDVWIGLRKQVRSQNYPKKNHTLFKLVLKWLESVTVTSLNILRCTSLVHECMIMNCVSVFVDTAGGQ